MTASSDEPPDSGSSPEFPQSTDLGSAQHARTGLGAQLLQRRSLLAGAAGLGAIGIGAGIAAALGGGGGGTTPVAGTTRPTSTRPTTSSPRTTGPTSSAPTTTSASPTATTTAPTSAPATSSAPPPTSSAPHPPPTSSAPPPPPTTTHPPTSTPPPPPPGEFLANTADVPLKGGVIVSTDGETVVTHPVGSTFCAFTAICTHMGCTVSEVKKNVITCFCHGSQYDAATGEVVTPPAPDPLARKSIVVQDGKIYLT